MVQFDIFGFDPLLVYLVCMIAIIIIAFIALSNEDPLLVLINTLILLGLTVVLGNVFRYSVFGVTGNLKIDFILMLGNFPANFIVYMILNAELASKASIAMYLEYIVIGIVVFLAIIKGYSALRGGWKNLKPDQFKEK